jgi:sugar (pentulose or hexulose) kinase
MIFGGSVKSFPLRAIRGLKIKHPMKSSMPDTSPLVLGIDSSTTACKAVVWDCRGNAVAQGAGPLPLNTPQPTWHEQPAEAWWTAMVKAVRQAASGVEPGRLKALCIAHQRETFVPVDTLGRPLAEGITWLDERARELLPELEQSFASIDFHKLTGKRLSVNLTIAKIAWLKKYRPAVFAQADKYLDVHSFLVRRLTGIACAGWGCADPTGMFDIQNNCWADGLLDRLGIRPSQLPELCAPGTVIGSVLPAAAEECGLPAGLPVAAGIGDGQASGLGVNITSPGDAYLSLGTSMISGAFSAECVIDPAFRTMCGGIPGTYLLETVLLGGAYTVAWFMEKMAGRPGDDPAALRDFYERAAGEIPPGSGGLVAVPYWNSVLGPYWDPAASGIVIGWRGHHTPAHLYRAILEGTAFEQRLETQGVEQALGRAVRRYIAIGGGAQSGLWRRILADITGRPVYRAAAAEAAALGAGILAAVAAGCFADVRQAAGAMTRILPDPVEPDPARQAFYNRMFEEVYRPLFPAIRPYVDKLAEIAE